ncbi:Histidinol dehydrogenase chloroplastic [Euphorbia peplus]|nr:Histidinol dehydrogenase chloroplastic [Euphorbia peplus]
MHVFRVMFSFSHLSKPHLTHQFRLLGAPRHTYLPCQLCFPRGSTFNRIRCGMKSYRLSELPDAEIQSLKARPRIDFSSIFNIVNPIVDDVRNRGDAAVKEYTAKFD